MTDAHEPERVPLEAAAAALVDPGGPGELRARAARIRARAQELIDALGPEHPLVSAALERAEALEHEADRPGEVRLR